MMDKSLKISITDRLLLIELFRSSNKQYFIYDLHKKYNILPSNIIKSILKYEPLGVIEYTNKNIILTDYGVKWIISNRLRIFGEIDNLWWKNIPKNHVLDNKSKNKSYIPKKCELGLYFFEDLQ